VRKGSIAIAVNNLYKLVTVGLLCIWFCNRPYRDRFWDRPILYMCALGVLAWHAVTCIDSVYA